MKDCFFCGIVAKEVPAYIVYEDDRTVAFLDIMPRSPGHVMVIPKYHAPTLVALPDSEIGPLFTSVKKVTELLAQKLMLDGFTIGINHGRVSGQEVDHLHVHIMPRSRGDGGGPVQSLVNHKPKESLDEIKRKIVD